MCRDRLTGKERLARIFNHQDIDRIPLWMLFPLRPWSLAVNVHAIPSYKEVTAVVLEKTDFIHRLNYSRPLLLNAHPDVVYNNTKPQDGFSMLEDCFTVRYKNRALTRGRTIVDDKVVVVPLVKEIEDLKFLMEIPYKMHIPDVSDYEDEVTLVGDRGIIAIMMSDPFGFLKHITSETDFPLFIYEEPEKISAFFDEIQRRNIEYYKWFLERDLGDIYWLDGSEYIAPPFLGPDFFGKYGVKYLSEIVNLVRSYGKKSMIHCHGKVGRILEHFRTINMDSLHPIEPPPMGDTTLRNAREILGPDKILTGNIEYGDLVLGHTEDDITAMALDIIEESKKGPIVMAISGSPTLNPLPPEAARNHLRLIETVLTKGFY
jgi:uroporphyrinogen-III decarboxylase